MRLQAVSALAVVPANGDETGRERPRTVPLRRGLRRRAPGPRRLLEAAKAASARARTLVGELGAEQPDELEAERSRDRRGRDAPEDLGRRCRSGKPSLVSQAVAEGSRPRRRACREAREQARGGRRLRRGPAFAALTNGGFRAALQRAEAAVPEAIKAVVAAEASELAERILDLEAEAAELHEKLGIFGAPVFLPQFLKAAVRERAPLRNDWAGLGTERRTMETERCSLGKMEAIRRRARAGRRRGIEIGLKLRPLGRAEKARAVRFRIPRRTRSLRCGARLSIWLTVERRWGFWWFRSRVHCRGRKAGGPVLRSGTRLAARRSARRPALGGAHFSREV